MTHATAFAPGSIGNVGPGFDVLGLAVDGIGDRVTVELTRDASSRVADITGRDAELVPRDAQRNCAVIAAEAYLRPFGYRAVVTIEKGLALAGGMGGSAASSVAGAYAAGLALGQAPNVRDVLAAALEGEAAVAGRHLDNIAPSVVGGLALVRSVEPIDVVRLNVAADWWIALVTPRVRIQTKEARALLPDACDRVTWIQQMANTTALAHAFATGDGELLRRALDDRYAEPRRAPLIPRFAEAKRAALDAGAFGGSISGSGPTLFAITADERIARACADAMRQAFGGNADVHVGAVAKEGVRRA
ncbi:MAG: homoserine kinase [Acidobacteria bacterium]|nr:homoserine kinase [Acidobacteriota bacterium]MBV9475498.1 homoserine kinase [Acidobacteriota bacterium]